MIKTKTITITILDIREIKHVSDRTSKERTNFISMITEKILRRRGGRKEFKFQKKNIQLSSICLFVFFRV